MKTTQPNFKTRRHIQFGAATLLAAGAVFAIATVRTFAAEVNATYVTGTEIPLRSDGFTAMGKSVNLTLNFAPAPGTQLMVVQNTGPGIIRGTFSNLTQGQIVDLSYAGLTYHFVANYHGGDDGNDLVLLWTNGDPLPADKKLDDQLRLALKQSRGEAPFDKPTTLKPDIPGNFPEGVLVDMEASVSKQLLDQVALVGGKVASGSVTATTIQAVVPLSQLETLAGRDDVKSISTARPTMTSRVTP